MRLTSAEKRTIAAIKDKDLALRSFSRLAYLAGIKGGARQPQ